jgi:protein-S-isoprenylcysteine O-methyltransferase Ste14
MDRLEQRLRIWTAISWLLPTVVALHGAWQGRHASGAVLSILGIAFIMWGRITLGRMYNVSSAFGNRLYADQELVTSGPFALARHPMYLGALIAGMGGVLLFRTWSAVLVLAHEPVFWVRAGREDQALEAEFGEKWRAYARRVHAGVPVLGGPARRRT